MTSSAPSSAGERRHDDILDPRAYTTLFDQSVLPTITIDHERRKIIHVNRAVLDFLGLDAAQVLSRPATDFLVELSPDRLIQIRALRGHETAAIREVATALGVRTVEINIVPSGVTGIAFVQAVDLTELLALAERAERDADALARTQAALSTVAARLAHDLRGPMAAITGFSDLLLLDQGSIDDAQRANILTRISANTHALTEMTASILSETDAGATRPEDSSFEVDDLFRAIRAITEAQVAEAIGVLEATTEVATLPVPVGRIRQAVVNLVSNSIKYREPSRPLHVEVEVRTSDDGIEIVVRDNGKGMSEDPTALFEAGVRGPEAAGTPGAGLGLAFVRAAVESAGGQVRAHHRAVGAELVITLPLPPEDDEIAPSAGAEPTCGLSGPQLRRVIEEAPIATFVIDIAVRKIVCVNRTSIDLLGFEEQDILGRPGSDFVDEQDVAEALRRRVLDEPNAREPLRTHLRGARGAIPARVWVTAVEGTALAIAQAIPDDALIG